ncbi:hypothetical protein NPIL_243681 [Nephila pilipes]|uniref:Uncharacterized protein n=1 Tax=Nephila pilipes TaxID=299642 RepID=A0A8X6Q6T3_NEPPI|nr:hypothetical protein NPIL_243681 [Nephila pilipes]
MGTQNPRRMLRNALRFFSGVASPGCSQKLRSQKRDSDILSGCSRFFPASHPRANTWISKKLWLYFFWRFLVRRRFFLEDLHFMSIVRERGASGEIPTKETFIGR